MVMSNNVNLFFTSDSPHLVSVAFALEVIPESDSTVTCLSRAAAALGNVAHRAPVGVKTEGSGPLCCIPLSSFFSCGFALGDLKFALSSHHIAQIVIPFSHHMVSPSALYPLVVCPLVTPPLSPPQWCPIGYRSVPMWRRVLLVFRFRPCKTVGARVHS